jgi:hypothetical protein
MEVNRRLIILHLGLVALYAVSGCGGEPPRAQLATPAPVHGKVFFPDKSPLRGGVIYFSPLEVTGSDGLRYEAAGLVDEKGNYKLGFNGDGKGVPPGEYKVSVMPRDYQELPNSNSKSIPQRIQDKSTTHLTATVIQGDNELNFELK